jgi:hypothetical protein
MSDEKPNAVLRGGPLAGAALTERVTYVEDIEIHPPVVKLFLGNRYEHFHAAAETLVVDDRELPVLSWSHSTYVAE